MTLEEAKKLRLGDSVYKINRAGLIDKMIVLSLKINTKQAFSVGLGPREGDPAQDYVNPTSIFPNRRDAVLVRREQITRQIKQLQGLIEDLDAELMGTKRAVT